MNNELITLLDNTSIKIDSPYKYEDKCVPRVTEILSSMLHEDYLMTWANNIGFYKHQKYKTVLDRSAEIGTFVHDSIDEFIKNGTELDIYKVPGLMRNEVLNAYKGFKLWWEVITKNKYKIIYNEKKLICKYFGGTLDLLIEINGKTYLVDFKTSNHPSYKYTLQLSAYRYMLRQLYNINVDGCIILMLDKKAINYTEILYSFDIFKNLEYFDYCEEAFLSLVYAYYNRHRIETLFSSI